MERWSDGAMERWSDGAMERCDAKNAMAMEFCMQTQKTKTMHAKFTVDHKSMFFQFRFLLTYCRFATTSAQ